MIDEILQQYELQHIDIIIKCKKYPEFRRELQQIQRQYYQDLQLANQMIQTLQKQQNRAYFQILRRDKIYINFYGRKLEKLTEEEFNRIYLLWILKMEKQIKNNYQQRYSVIYYHSKSNSSDPFIFIRDSYKKLPIQYYALLDKIYVVKGDFFVRNAGFLQFGRLYKLYSRRIVYVENLQQFSKIDEVKKNQIIESLPQEYRLLKELRKFRKEEQFSGNLQIGNINEQKPIYKKHEVKDCLSVQLSQHLLDENGLPIYLMSLISTMRKYRQMMELEGIFRKSGSIEQQLEIIQQLSKMDKVDILKQSQNKPWCGYAIAGVLKKFFCRLSDPLFSYEIYNYVLELQCIQEEDQLEIINKIIGSLSNTSKKIFLQFIRFIRVEVLKYRKCNKMNENSMAIVFSPCFFRPRVETFHDLLNSGKFASILYMIFKKYDQNEQRQQNYVIKISPQKRGSKGSKGSRGSGQGELKQKNPNIV